MSFPFARIIRRASPAVAGAAKAAPVAPFSRGFGANLAEQLKLQAGGGALIGGALGAAGGALSSSPEERGSAALQGAVSGGLLGGLGGAVTAPITAAARAGRLHVLDRMLPAQMHPYTSGHLPGTGPAAVDRIHQGKGMLGGWTDNVRDAWKHRGTALGRANAFEAAVAPAVVAAEAYGGDKLLSVLQPQPQPQTPPQPQPQGAYVGQVPKTAAETHPPVMPRLDTLTDEEDPEDPKELPLKRPLPNNIGTQLGGLAGGVGAEAALRQVDPQIRARLGTLPGAIVGDVPTVIPLERAQGPLSHLHPDAVLRRLALPGLGAAVGTIGGYYTMQHLNDRRGTPT